jgi:hypothetical protein
MKFNVILCNLETSDCVYDVVEYGSAGRMINGQMYNVVAVDFKSKNKKIKEA